MVAPIRDGKGSDIIGPRNIERENQGPDMVRPPSTDSGSLPPMKWSFSDSHVRIEEGGWARQTTIVELPTSVDLAGVNMRLEEGAIRELHWHKEAEWAYILEGSCRITVLDLEGGSYEDDISKGDIWYFPTGRPHSLQGIGKGGCEFLLIFDDGHFDENSTFLLTDWLARTPKEVVAKNFQLFPKLFDSLSEKEKYIFQGKVPNTNVPGIPHNASRSKYRFTHKLLAQSPMKVGGGEVRIVDTGNFPISSTVAAAHVIIEPGALRELHWHPNADEWSYFISGKARVTVFAGGGISRTFDYQAGDVGIVPRSMGHYVENVGSEPVEMLEVFRAPKFEDFSLAQWLGSSPPQMVIEHLNLKKNDALKFIESLQPIKDPIKKNSKL